MLAPALVAIGAMFVIAVVQIVLSAGGSSEVCAITVTQGERATTPEAAFERWFSEGGQQELARIASERPTPARADLVQVGEREWRWNVFGDQTVTVKTSRRPGQDSYWVSEIVDCE